MIYVVRTFVDDVGKRYHQIKINTACCKRDFLVMEESDGVYYDLENNELCLPGTNASIKQQLDFQKKL